jgi:putative glutathione S-transferase
MGQLVDGVWQAEGYRPPTDQGEFQRPPSVFRDWVTADGASGYPAAAGRYRLYVSLACPWAHRTLIFRRLKGLEDAIDVVVVHPLMGEQGWAFAEPDEEPECRADPALGATHLHQLYTHADPGCTARVTTPTLWDTATETIASNESADIIRMLNGEFDAFATHPQRDFCPPELEEAIDDVNEWIYTDVNNGVYRTGFAETQAAYEAAFDRLFAALDALEDRLAERPFLVGDRLTEADIRLLVTLLRFDPVYHGHFKCNRHRLVDFPHLWDYTRALYQLPEVRDTVSFDHIKRHYYGSHPRLNPLGIVPKGPQLDWQAPPEREAVLPS